MDTTPRPRVLVIGDAILDRYLHGRDTRLSPEGPGTVFSVERIEDRLGGAAAVAYLCAGLGCRVELRCPVGADPDSLTLSRLCSDSDIRLNHWHGQTRMTVKERHVQDGRTMPGRTDHDCQCTEQPSSIAARTSFAPDVILVADYRRGAVSDWLVPTLRKQHLGVPIVVDPGRGVDWKIYRGATVIKANRAEASAVPADTEYGALLVTTLGADGLTWTDDESPQGSAGHHVPIVDPTGCGDTVLAVLGWALARGLGLGEACRLANKAGAVQVQRMGVQQVRPHELETFGAGKLITAKTAQTIAARLRRDGKRLVFTNGCFDVFHAGHAAFLQECREHGDVLIVGLNSDDSVRQLKGASRPVNPLEQRATVLSALACIDYIVPFDDDTQLALVESLLPDVLCKGEEYAGQHVVGAELADKVILLPRRYDVSTTAILGSGGARQNKT